MNHPSILLATSRRARSIRTPREIMDLFERLHPKLHDHRRHPRARHCLTGHRVISIRDGQSKSERISRRKALQRSGEYDSSHGATPCSRRGSVTIESHDCCAWLRFGKLSGRKPSRANKLRTALTLMVYRRRHCRNRSRDYIKGWPTVAQTFSSQARQSHDFQDPRSSVARRVC